MPSETQGFRRHFLSGLEGVLSVVRFVGQVNVEAGAFACVLVGGGLPGKQSAEAGAFDDDAFFCSLSGGMEEDGLILRLADEPVEVGHFFFNGGTFAAFGIHGVEIDDVGFALCLNKCGHLFGGVAEMEVDARGGVLRFGIEEGAADAV